MFYLFMNFIVDKVIVENKSLTVPLKKHSGHALVTHTAIQKYQRSNFHANRRACACPGALQTELTETLG